MAARPLRTRKAKFRMEAECGQNFSSPFVVASCKSEDGHGLNRCGSMKHGAWSINVRALIIANCMQISICLQIGVVGKNAMQSLMAELRIQSMNAGASRMGGRGGIWI